MSEDLSSWLAAAGRVPLLTPAEELHLGTMVREWQDWPGGPDAAPAPVRRHGHFHAVLHGAKHVVVALIRCIRRGRLYLRIKSKPYIRFHGRLPILGFELFIACSMAGSIEKPYIPL